MDLGKKRGRPAKKVVQNRALQQAIQVVGGVKKLALELGVHPNNVSDWLYREPKIPARHAQKIVQVTRGLIKAEELRPDIFIPLEFS